MVAVGEPLPFRDTPEGGKGYLNVTGAGILIRWRRRAHLRVVGGE